MLVGLDREFESRLHNTYIRAILYMTPRGVGQCAQHLDICGSPALYTRTNLALTLRFVSLKVKF